MRYRLREHHPDSDFAALVSAALRDVVRPGDALELVFNGDVLDFDAPWVKDGASSFDEFPLTDGGCAEHARRIALDHGPWFDAVARVVAAGHRVLFVSGNHDIELYWPGVRRALRDVIAAGCARAGTPIAPRELEERVRFRTWFHVTEDRIYLEHGSQYDHLNGVRYPMLPLTRERDRIHPVTGKLAFKRTGARMGYFNPYYEETFYLGLFGYLAHFARHYALSPRRHIARTWAIGAVRTALEVLRHRHREPWDDEAVALARAETGASEEAIRATQALAARSAEETMIPILRELWLDRVAIALFGAVAAMGAALAWGLTGAGAAVGAAACGLAAYEVLTPKPDLRTYDSPPSSIERLFDIHDVRAVCLGHTHRPTGSWKNGRFFGNSGTWCPAFHDATCTRPVLEARPLLLLTACDGDLSGGLAWLRDGRIVPADGEAWKEPGDSAGAKAPG